MIYAYATDDRTLTIFADAAAAVAHCEGFDVAEGEWRFFEEDGRPLEAVFSRPATKGLLGVTHGRYALRRVPPDAPGDLRELLPTVAAVEGPPPLDSVAEVARAIDAARLLADADGRRKTEIVRHADGNFGFVEWKWSDEEQSWIASGRYSQCRTDSREAAEREARERMKRVP